MVGEQVVMHQVMQAEGLIQRATLRAKATLRNVKWRRVFIETVRDGKLKELTHNRRQRDWPIVCRIRGIVFLVYRKYTG